MSRTIGRNGIRMKSRLSRPITVITRMSALSLVENGLTWYQSVYSQSHTCPSELIIIGTGPYAPGGSEMAPDAVTVAFASAPEYAVVHAVCCLALADSYSWSADARPGWPVIVCSGAIT